MPRHFYRYHEQLITRHERRYGPLHRFASESQHPRAAAAPVRPRGLRRIISRLRVPVHL